MKFTALGLTMCLAVPLAAQGRRPQMPAQTRQAITLDLAGQGARARRLWQKEINTAATPTARAAAERNMAMSWAFSGNCAQTAAYETRVIAYWKTHESAQPHNAFYQEGEMADEAAAVCIDLGNTSAAARLYKLGHDRGLLEPDIPAGRRDLWNYRYQHALARLAARRGKHATAVREVAAARATLAQMQGDDAKLYQQQGAFLPYLEGYVAYYAGDYPTALRDFQQDKRHDPFLACMLGLTYEKLHQPAQARAAYEEAAKTRAHNPPAAFAIPFTRKKLRAQ
ncbi:MAG: hypothetical protein ACRD1Y_13575 [Terriglobales bacterium]